MPPPFFFASSLPCHTMPCHAMPVCVILLLLLLNIMVCAVLYCTVLYYRFSSFSHFVIIGYVDNPVWRKRNSAHHPRRLTYDTILLVWLVVGGCCRRRREGYCVLSSSSFFLGSPLHIGVVWCGGTSMRMRMMLMLRMIRTHIRYTQRVCCCWLHYRTVWYESNRINGSEIDQA